MHKRSRLHKLRLGIFAVDVPINISNGGRKVEERNVIKGSIRKTGRLVAEGGQSVGGLNGRGSFRTSQL